MEEKLLVEMEDVTAGYPGHIAFRDVSIKVSSKEHVAIVGPNGGGKSTMLKVMMGLLPRKPVWLRSAVRILTRTDALKKSIVSPAAEHHQLALPGFDRRYCAAWTFRRIGIGWKANQGAKPSD